TLSPLPHPNALLGLGLGIVVWTLLIDVVFYIYVAVHGAVVSAILKRSRGLDPLGFEVITLLTLAAIFPLIHLAKPGPWAALSCLPAGMLFAVIEAWQDREGRQLRGVAWLVDHWWVPALAAVPAYIIGTHSVLGAKDYSSLLVNYLWIQLILVAFGLVFLALIIWGPQQWGLNRWLSSKAMVTAGTLTYGTYLWHPVVIALLHQHADSWGLWPALLVTLLGSVALASVTYRLIEYPLAQTRTRLREEDATPPTSATPPPTSPTPPPTAS
ncbi:MAG TPA: acyltransferase family protein, partial [Acidimicrobiales bacterium]